MKWTVSIAAAGLLGLLYCSAATNEAVAGKPAAAKPAAAEGADSGDKSAEKHRLVYKFSKGETVRWRVEHRSKIRTTIQGATQTAEALTESVKVWRVTEVDAEGNATFEHSVESVAMRQKLSNRQEVTFNSLTDKEPPTEPGFKEAAALIGVPLTQVKMSPQGKVLERQDRVRRPAQDEGQMTILLSGEPLAVGQTWSFPYNIDVTLENGGRKQIKTRQLYTLLSVEHGVARIKIETQILTPVNNPAIEAQLVQRENSGEVRFDIEHGRVTTQQVDVDKQVYEFAGKESTLHCVARFNEELLEDAEPTARKE